jgi:hypothetical protein
MYTQTWSKYLPVIKILLKRSISAEQHLNLNVSDFEKKGSRKAAEKFTIQFRSGKASGIVHSSDIAKELAAVLLNDAGVNDLLAKNNYQVSMNSKFQLSIQYIPEVLEVIPE